jgi:hypothetical protein
MTEQGDTRPSRPSGGVGGIRWRSLPINSGDGPLRRAASHRARPPPTSAGAAARERSPPATTPAAGGGDPGAGRDGPGGGAAARREHQPAVHLAQAVARPATSSSMMPVGTHARVIDSPFHVGGSRRAYERLRPSPPFSIGPSPLQHRACLAGQAPDGAISDPAADLSAL